MMQLRNGIFDEACISVIATGTVSEIARLAGVSSDVRRFRPNIVVRLLSPAPFQEDAWLGGVLSFGGEDDGPAVIVTQRDLRCSMLNLDPDTARPAPEILKAVVRVNQNHAGVYGAVTRTGILAVGQSVFLEPRS
jgi:uncharacterized protein YcbX